MSNILNDPDLLNNGIYTDVKGVANRLTVEDFMYMLGQLYLC